MNKLTLNKGKAIACLILMCLFLVQGCRKDLLQPNSKDLQNGISIAEARKYFNTNIKRTVKPGLLMSTGPLQKGITLADVLANKEPIWEKAYEKMLSTGSAVKMPIDFGKAYAVVNAQKTEAMPLSSLNYLFMYKDSLQAIHTEWVILLPDSAWLYGNRSVYSGRIIVKDWEGKTIRNLIYNNIGSPYTSSNIKGRVLSSNGKIQNTADEIPLIGSGQLCIRVSLTCPHQSPCTNTYCDMCLNICAKEFCNWIPNCSPECDLPGEPGGNGGGGGGPVNPSGPGGGGAYPPDDCGGGGQIPRVPTNNNGDPNANSIPVPPCIPKPGKLDGSFEEAIPIPTSEELAPIFVPFNFDVEYDQDWYDGEDELGTVDAEMLQQGAPNTDPIPGSYYLKGTGIDMTPATPRSGTTVHGAPRNAKYFWEQLMQKRPEMFSEDNRTFIRNNEFKSVKVDEKWIKYNPTHKSYMHNQLVHHHHQQRNMAFAIPAKVHQKWTSRLHLARAAGKISRLGGRLNSLGPFLELFTIITDIRTGNPDAFVNGFGATNEIGKLYKEQMQNFYFEITSQLVYKNSSGTVTRAIVTYDAFDDYIWDEDENRYMGVLKIATYVEDIDVINHRTNSLTKQ
jgi:hypothetical protein